MVMRPFQGMMPPRTGGPAPIRGAPMPINPYIPSRRPPATQPAQNKGGVRSQSFTYTAGGYVPSNYAPIAIEQRITPETMSEYSQYSAQQQAAYQNAMDQYNKRVAGIQSGTEYSSRYGSQPVPSAYLEAMGVKKPSLERKSVIDYFRSKYPKAMTMADIESRVPGYFRYTPSGQRMAIQ